MNSQHQRIITFNREMRYLALEQSYIHKQNSLKESRKWEHIVNLCDEIIEASMIIDNANEGPNYTKARGQCKSLMNALFAKLVNCTFDPQIPKDPNQIREYFHNDA